MKPEIIRDNEQIRNKIKEAKKKYGVTNRMIVQQLWEKKKIHVTESGITHYLKNEPGSLNQAQILDILDLFNYQVGVYILPNE
jgi:hypothetical protein